MTLSFWIIIYLLVSIGIATWISIEYFIWMEQILSMPPHFFAFLVSIPAYFIGDFLVDWISNDRKSTKESLTK
jgi:cell shape-determining protein MreC